MSTDTRVRGVAAPRATAALGALFAGLVLAQGAFAGGFAGGHHGWLAWHRNLGDLLVVIPVTSLIVGLACRHRQVDTTVMLASRVALVILVGVVEVTGHAGGGWLALHIPAAVAAVGLVVRQALVASRAGRDAPASSKPLARKESAS